MAFDALVAGLASPVITDATGAVSAESRAAAQTALRQRDAHLEELTRTNAREHEALARQTAQEIAKLSEDARFLNQVRELIRFVKDA